MKKMHQLNGVAQERQKKEQRNGDRRENQLKLEGPGRSTLYDDMRPGGTHLRRFEWQFISLSNSKVIFAKLIRDSGCTNELKLWNVDRVVKKESKAF